MHAELWQCINDIVEKIGRLGGCRKFKLCVLSGLFLLIVIYEGCAWPSDWDFSDISLSRLCCGSTPTSYFLHGVIL